MSRRQVTFSRNTTPSRTSQRYCIAASKGRISEPDDIARVIGYLVSPGAEFVSRGALSADNAICSGAVVR